MVLYDSTFLKNHATNYMMDAIKAIKGVGSVQEFGSDYAMRIWLIHEDAKSWCYHF